MSRAPRVVLLAWRPMWGGVWYSVQKRGRALEIGGGRRKASAVLFVFQAFSFLGSPAVFRAPLRPGLLGVFSGGGPDPARGFCRDALGPPDKGNQLWVLPATKLTSPPLKQFSQPGRCNCVFQLINPRWRWHKAHRLHRAEHGSRRIPQVPAAWRLETRPPVVPKMPHLFIQALNTPPPGESPAWLDSARP